MSRTDWCDEVCHRVVAAVGREAPRGLGTWDEAWRMVEAPSDDLLEALRAFEDREADDKAHIVALAEALLDAWREAGEAYLRERGAPAQTDAFRGQEVP